MVMEAFAGTKQPDDCGLGGHVALMRHPLLQASPSMVLPSSHSSPAVVTPFPHRVIVQLPSQPSPSRLLPSSHSSPSAASIWPLPHSADMHCALQPPTFGGSQCSRPAQIPLPHAVIVQLLSQPSPFTLLASSHCSPLVTMPLPQAVRVQLLSQPSPSVVFSSSHSSPEPGSMIPLPHVADWHCAVQFADGGSQTSPAARLTIPSPHRANVQLALQVAETPAVSHCSPASVTPLPHTGGNIQ